MTSSAAGDRLGAPPPRAIPGWVLRLVLGAATLTASIVVTVAAPRIEAASLLGTLLVMAAIGAALAPGSALPLTVLIGVIVFRAVTPGPVLDATLVVLVALVPLIHQLAGICAPIPPRSSCQWRALRSAIARYAIAVIPVLCAVTIAWLSGW